ncbi:hypothetical protein [Pedobacter sp.]|uniref:hypothetical protein n=1 Tax=Pedobacter sp. TaxID=1411316 RepID=UPI003C4AB433
MRKTHSRVGRLSKPNPYYTIFWSGLISGILDAIAACTVFYLKQGFSPGQVMKFIATGVYGPQAFQGGWVMVLTGLFLHFFIAFTIAWLYYMVFPNLRALNSKPVLSGIVYGGLIWIVMNIIIIPLTQVPPAPFDPKGVMVSIVWHMILVGLPIAIITKRAFNKN